MAHFAKLDENSVVQEVVVVANSAIDNLQFPESESVGVEFCKSLYGADTVWKQTSYNGAFRKKFAAIGMIYNADIDAFIGLQPFPSWSLDPNTGDWCAPVPYPNSYLFYDWDEQTQTWVHKYRYDELGFPPPDQLVP